MTFSFFFSKDLAYSGYCGNFNVLYDFEGFNVVLLDRWDFIESLSNVFMGNCRILSKIIEYFIFIRI